VLNQNPPLALLRSAVAGTSAKRALWSGTKAVAASLEP